MIGITFEINPIVIYEALSTKFMLNIKYVIYNLKFTIRINSFNINYFDKQLYFLLISKD